MSWYRSSARVCTLRKYSMPNQNDVLTNSVSIGELDLDRDATPGGAARAASRNTVREVVTGGLQRLRTLHPARDALG